MNAAAEGIFVLFLEIIICIYICVYIIDYYLIFKANISILESMHNDGYDLNIKGYESRTVRFFCF